MPINEKTASLKKSEKSQTGISGLDEITDGGLPKNRTTIVSGNAGCGKTVMAMEFLINGAEKYNEPGVFISFEETNDEIAIDMKSFNFKLDKLISEKKIYVEYMEIEKAQVMEAGKYDLEGLFVRLQNAVTTLGARRIVLDSLDALFYGLDIKILRQEIKKLFKWFKQIQVTALVTSEIDNGFIAKYILEKYVADCVIALDNRVFNQIATRRLRIVKMRGSVHGNNEYPFIIDSDGVSVLPLFSEMKDYTLSNHRIVTGIAGLDGMLDGKGYYQGSSILVSGSAGTGKTSVAASLIDASCRKKIRSLFCAFEESTTQIIRNMCSIGLDLNPYVEKGVLQFYSFRPTLQTLELHFISLRKQIDLFKPEIIILDPITNVMSEGINSEVRLMLSHFVDYVKSRNITILFTAAITQDSIKNNPSDEGISTMVDTWILLRDIEENSERNRGIYVLKSRGMNHSTQVREFVITNSGIDLLPTYIGPAGVLTGSAKLENTLKEEQQGVLRENRLRNEKSEIERKRKILEENINMLKMQFESEVQALQQTEVQMDIVKDMQKKSLKEITDLRNKTNSSSEKSKNRNK